MIRVHALRPGLPRPARGVVRLRARRGAIVVLVGVLFVGLVAIGAITMDMSRLGNLRAELQTSADAAVHAGMVELIANPTNQAAALDSARAYALRNLAMQAVPVIDQLELGTWNGTTFIPGTPIPNAMRIQVSLQSAGLIMGVVGVSAPVVHASAVATSDTFGPPPMVRPLLVK